MTYQMRIKFVGCDVWENWKLLKPLVGMELDDVYAIDFRVKPKYEPGPYISRDWTIPPENFQTSPYVVWWNQQPDLESWERVTVEAAEENDE